MNYVHDIRDGKLQLSLLLARFYEIRDLRGLYAENTKSILQIWECLLYNSQRYYGGSRVHREDSAQYPASNLSHALCNFFIFL